MGKKFSGVSQTMSRFRGWIQAGATLLTNLHLPNFFKGGLYQGTGKTVCVPGLNCYSCPAASGACPIGAFQAVVGSSKFSFSYYITGFLILLGVERYDLVLLDLNLPKKDGMTVLRTLRQTDRETRVLILSARSEVEDKVQGLDAGANDYLAKPFHLAELEARIRSLTLRQFTQQGVLLTCGGLRFDTRSRTAAVNGQTLTLTRKETGILEYLMVHQGRPVSQEELMEHVWDNSVDSFSNSIRVHISALRKKLRAALGYDPIRNRIGEGYLMGGDEA